jgi:hypothetical protein
MLVDEAQAVELPGGEPRDAGSHLVVRRTVGSPCGVGHATILESKSSPLVAMLAIRESA